MFKKILAFLDVISAFGKPPEKKERKVSEKDLDEFVIFMKKKEKQKE